MEVIIKMNYKRIGKAKLLFFCTIILTLLFSFSLFAAEEVIVIPEFPYHNFQLENGLEVYVFEDDSIPMVEVSIYYKLGSIDEEKGLTGISHFLEHTMFLGTEALPKGRLDELISSVGGDFNAYTSFDHTCYYIEVPSSMLELAISLEADRMGNLLIDPIEIEREREVISQERRTRIENNVLDAGLEKIKAAAFPESSLNHNVIGWMDDINNISVNDIRRYYENYYQPNNAVLVVSGDVNLEEVEELTDRYFGIYEAGEIERPEFFTDLKDEELSLTIEGDTSVPLTAMIYRIPEGNHPDVMAIDIFLDIFINIGSSRVRQQLQREENIILQASARTQSLREPGYALIYYIPMDEGLLEIAQEAFDKELEKILNEGINSEEFKIVKKAYEKALIFSQRDPDAMASSIAMGKLSFNNPDLYRDELRYLNQLTEEDIIEVVKNYFRKDNRTVGNIVSLKE